MLCESVLRVALAVIQRNTEQLLLINHCLRTFAVISRFIFFYQSLP